MYSPLWLQIQDLFDNQELLVSIVLWLLATPVIIFVALYVLWVFYLAVMALKRARDDKILSDLAFYLAQPIVIFGVAYDIICNLTVMTILLFELPQEWKVTDRVSRHLDSGGWRGLVSTTMCHNFLDSFDPSGCHCKK